MPDEAQSSINDRDFAVWHSLLLDKSARWKWTDGQLATSLAILRNAVEMSSGSVQAFIDTVHRADSSNKFAIALQEALSAQPLAVRTRQIYACRVRRLLRQIPTVPDDFVRRITLEHVPAKDVNPILGRRYVGNTRKMLEGWIEIFRAETRMDSPKSLQTVFGFILRKCLPKLGLDLDNWPDRPEEQVERAFEQEPGLAGPLCSPDPRYHGWLQLFLTHVLKVPKRVDKPNVKKRRREEYVHSHDTHRISSSDVDKLYDAAQGDLGSKLPLMLMLTTAMRIGGIVNMRVQDVADIDSAGKFVVRLRGSTTCKGRKVITFAMNAEVRQLMCDWLTHKRPLNSSPYVFPAQRGSKPACTEAIWKRFRALCKRAGLKGAEFHPHALRHTCAHLLLEAGNPVDVVSKFLNHSSSQVTEQVYLKENLSETLSRANVPWLEKNEIMSKAPPPRCLSGQNADRLSRLEELSKGWEVSSQVAASSSSTVLVANATI